MDLARAAADEARTWRGLFRLPLERGGGRAGLAFFLEHSISWRRGGLEVKPRLLQQAVYFVSLLLLLHRRQLPGDLDVQHGHIPVLKIREAISSGTFKIQKKEKKTSTRHMRDAGSWTAHGVATEGGGEACSSFG